MPAEEQMIRNSPLFDPDWYLSRYPDVGLSGIDPAQHYLQFGALLGRDPGPDFSTRFYLEVNGDVARAGVNPLVHYERSGREEGRLYHPDAAGKAHAAAVSDHAVAAQPVDPPPDQPSARRIVDVVVPVYNALEDVKSCLAALSVARTGFHARVLLVNDCSDAATTAYLRAAAARLAQENVSFELYEHKTNRGYTVAVNTGLRASRADYVVTLNSDTMVTSNWLDGMVHCLESAPEIGIVGPLSNAATWQNVPALYDPAGGHAINTLPAGMTPEHMARIVRDASRQSYPRTTFVNGFCFLISRATIDAVGYMDEEAFPSGYGEENDFCIRAMDAGFALAYVDDVYVFHAKSKSFGSARRLALSKAGGEALRRKHGAEKFARLVHEVQKTEAMDAIRARVQAGLDAQSDGEVVHSAEMRLLPPGIYAPKDYQINPRLNGAGLMLPYEGAPGRVPTLDVGMHLHLHYTDLLDEFAAYLGHIPVPFHLYVSVPEGSDLAQITRRFETALPQARGRIEVKSFPNRGRDIGPFLAGFGRALRRHEYLCHIHSKRSPHNPAKKDWRMQLMTNLMGSQRIVAEIFRLFDHTPRLGMVFPDYHWSLANQISWGTNYAICSDLSARLDQPISPVHMAPFPAGSMFWARTSALAPLLDLDLGFDDFPREEAQVDGTLAHAVERMLGNIVLATGQELRQICSAKPYDLKSYYTAAWPYTTKPADALRAEAARYREARCKTAATVGLLCANSGGYDTPIAHEHLDPRIDYHLVADFPAPNYGFWIRHDMSQDGPATGRARAVKTSPLEYIDGYDIGIWIDANVMIRQPFDRYLDMIAAHPEIPVFGIPHPQRNCIYEEAQAVISHNKAQPDKVRAQMETYAAAGYPKRHGLIETNFLIYNLRHPRIKEVLQAWYKEVSERTHRDQLSLNFVLWQLGLDWMPVMSEGQNLRTHSDFAYFGHGQNGGYTAPVLPSKILSPRKPVKAH